MRRCWLRDVGLQINTNTNRSSAWKFIKFVFQCSVLVPNRWMWSSEHIIVGCFWISQHPQLNFLLVEETLPLWQSVLSLAWEGIVQAGRPGSTDPQRCADDQTCRRRPSQQRAVSLRQSDWYSDVSFSERIQHKDFFPPRYGGNDNCTHMTIIRDFRQLHNQYELLSVAFLSFSDFQFVLKKTLLT